MLAVTLSKRARAREVQLPAWNEALGLPRPWDQQWSLRLQQVVAFETDLLDYEDIFDGSHVIDAKVAELKDAAREELARIEAMGGAIAAVEQSYMKRKLVESNSRRLAAIEAGEQQVVGVNCFTESAHSPLTTEADGGFLAVDPAVEAEQVASLAAWRQQREPQAVAAAIAALKQAATESRNVMEPSIACAHAGVTTGEWGQVLREIFGEYRAPTGVGRAAGTIAGKGLAPVREAVERVSARLGRRLKMLVGKPGLDGHSNGAEQIAVRARDAGFEVVYEGIRLTPAQIANAALEEGVHIVGLSVLSGSHVALVGDVLARLKRAGLDDLPVVVGGIIPPEDAAKLTEAGVARIYTPKDYDLNAIMADIVELVDRSSREAA
jgi:ethylmalonyl-CoA mutase